MSGENSIYLGNATHPDQGEESVCGKITVGTFFLRFEAETVRLDFSFKQVQVDVDEEEERVHFSHPDYPGWTVTASNLDILQHRSFHKIPQLRRQVAHVQDAKEGLGRLKTTVVFLVAFAVVSVTILLVLSFSIRRLIDHIPVEVDRELGESYYAEAKSKFKLVEDAELKGHLDELVKRLADAQPQNGQHYEISIVDNAFPNAAALPGGRIFVNTGLITKADSAEEIAGVLAHEMAHVNKRHGVRSLISQRGPLLAMKWLLGGEAGLGKAVVAGSGLLIGMSFSRDFEREADDGGWNYLIAAHIDPRGLGRFLGKLQNDEEALGIQRNRSLSTHPATGERTRHLWEKWQKLDDKNGFQSLDSGWVEKYARQHTDRLL